MPAGHWVGELCGSPFATASAAAALAVVAGRVKEDARRDAYLQLAVRAVEWLAAVQTGEGGWGDARSGPANLAATTLIRAVIHFAEQAERFADALARSERYLESNGGTVQLRKQCKADRALLAAVMAHRRWRDTRLGATCRRWPSSMPGCRAACGAHSPARPPTSSRSASASGRPAISIAGREIHWHCSSAA